MSSPFSLTNKFIRDLANLQNKYARDMVDTLRDKLLDDIERHAPVTWTGSWEYGPGGDVVYVCKGKNHPEGYHEIGSMRRITFAACSAYDETVTTKILKNVSSFGYNETYSKLWTELADKILTIPTASLESVTFYKYLDEIEPIFMRIKHYW